jgi:hypothetical protein
LVPQDVSTVDAHDLAQVVVVGTDLEHDATSCRVRTSLRMCQRLIRHTAEFIATSCQMWRVALNPVSTTQANRLRMRKRSRRVYITETMSTAEPNHPGTSSNDIAAGYSCWVRSVCVSPVSAARSMASATSTVCVASSMVTMRRALPRTASRKASSSTSRGSRLGIA